MNTQQTISTRAWGEIALLSLIWGGSFLAFAFALKEVGVFTVVAFRVGGGAMLLAFYVLAFGSGLPKSIKIWGAFLVMGVLNNVIPFSLIAWGQLYVTSGLASILNASTAIFGVVIAAIVFSDERLTLRKSIGATLGFLGVATAIGLGELLQFNLTSLAQLAILGAAVSYGLAGSWARKMLQGMPPVTQAAGMTLCATFVIIPLALYFDGTPTYDYAPATWAAFIHLAVFCTAIAYLLYYRILKMAGSGNLMLVTLTISPVAIVLGAVVLGETLQWQAYAGFVLLAAGLIVIDGRVLKSRKAIKE